MRYGRAIAVAAAAGLVGAVVPAATTAANSPLGDFFFEFTRLTGEAEVPGPGDPDGSGFAIVYSTGDGAICYNLFVRRIESATMAHIHIGDEETPGPVVQGLEPPTDGTSSGCVQNEDLPRRSPTIRTTTTSTSTTSHSRPARSAVNWAESSACEGDL